MTIGLAVACFLAVPAHGGVTVLSEQYHASGETAAAWKFGAYAETMDSMGWASASSSFVFTVDSPILIITIVGDLWARAFPDTNGGISYSLTDNLTNEIIGCKSWSLSNTDDIGQAWGRTIEESTTYDLVTGNEYKLLLSADVTNADGSFAYLGAVLIPEPSSLMLLSFGGVGALFYRRRI
jgi:hypothetical protein